MKNKMKLYGSVSDWDTVLKANPNMQVTDTYTVKECGTIPWLSNEEAIEIVQQFEPELLKFNTLLTKRPKGIKYEILNVDVEKLAKEKLKKIREHKRNLKLQLEKEEQEAEDQQVKKVKRAQRTQTQLVTQVKKEKIMKTIKDFATQETMNEEVNPIYAFRMVSTELLTKMLREYDVNALIKYELSSRGQNADGQWVGFADASTQLGVNELTPIILQTTLNEEDVVTTEIQLTEPQKVKWPTDKKILAAVKKLNKIDASITQKNIAPLVGLTENQLDYFMHNKTSLRTPELRKMNF